MDFPIPDEPPVIRTTLLIDFCLRLKVLYPLKMSSIKYSTFFWNGPKIKKSSLRKTTFVRNNSKKKSPEVED